MSQHGTLAKGREREYYLVQMMECEHRVSMDKGVSSAVDKTAVKYGLFGGAFAGELRQSFENGLCSLLTINDIGPVECRQPNCSEKDCPDILHLLKI